MHFLILTSYFQLSIVLWRVYSAYVDDYMERGFIIRIGQLKYSTYNGFSWKSISFVLRIAIKNRIIRGGQRVSDVFNSGWLK